MYNEIEKEALEVAEKFYHLWTDYCCTPQMSNCCSDPECCGEQDWEEIEQIVQDIVSAYKAIKEDK